MAITFALFAVAQGSLPAAAADAELHTLTVTVNGPGVVWSSPPAINCSGGTCPANFTSDTSVTLNPNPQSGSSFLGWGGACSGTGDCVVNMTTDQVVTASFAGIGLTLQVTKDGAGSGTVASPSGIDCGDTCSVALPVNSIVTLTATPAPGSAFAAWNGGGCSATEKICTVFLSQSQQVAATFSIPHKIGVFRPADGSWFQDFTGNGIWDGCEIDGCLAFGGPGDVVVVGDWNGDGHSKSGVFRPGDGAWYLDYNGNGVFDGCQVDRCIVLGSPGDTPVVGDWNKSGRDKVGVFRNGLWFLDYNGNGVFDGCEPDKCIQWGGEVGDLPVVGDWKGDGWTKVGIFRNGVWYLDFTGNGLFQGCATDECIFWGSPGDTIVVGDWNGDGRTKVGIFRNGTWYLDYDGDGLFDFCVTDRCINFGDPSDSVVVGDWNGNGKTKIGVVRDGIWYLDFNGTGLWEGCGSDGCSSFGEPGDQFVVGRW